LIVIEDAAQAHGARYKGRGAGSIGDLACFSFYPGKNLGAYGEGGAVVTNNAEYVRRLKLLRDHGQSSKYHHEVLGYNYRMEGIQGAILRVKLRHLESWNAARRAHAASYRSLLGTDVGLLKEMSYGTPVYHVFPVFDQRRDQLQQHLTASGISTGIHYPIPVHLQPAFAGGNSYNLPTTERASSQTLSLPMYAELSESDIASVARAVNQFKRPVERTSK